MRYFCYISASKVDQFLAGLEEREVLESDEKSTVTKKTGISAGLSLIGHILQGKYSYGRSDMFQRDVKYRENLVQRLFRLLQLIGDSVEDFSKSHGAIKANTFYFMDAEFKLKKTDKNTELATIAAPLQGKEELQLTCSLKHFSSTLNTEGYINSTNGAFFSGVPLTFETVFFLTHKTGNTYLGTPLFLALSSDSNVLL